MFTGKQGKEGSEEKEADNSDEKQNTTPGSNKTMCECNDMIVSIISHFWNVSASSFPKEVEAAVYFDTEDDNIEQSALRIQVMTRK